MSDLAKPKLAKAHAKTVTDEYLRLGWTLRHEFRAEPDQEPYEYILEWLHDSEPVSIDWTSFRKIHASKVAVKAYFLVLAVAAMVTSCVTPPMGTPAPLTAPVKAYQTDANARADAVWKQLSSRATNKLSLGTVKVAFYILPDGRVRNIRIVSNTGNQALAELAIRTIEDTRMPPIPAVVAATLPDGLMPAVYDFNIHK